MKDDESPLQVAALVQLFDSSGAAVSLFHEADVLVYGNPTYFELTHQQVVTHPIWADTIRDNHRLNHGLRIATNNGVATAMVTDENSISRLLDAADKAMYQAKHRGRDKITLENPSLTGNNPGT